MKYEELRIREDDYVVLSLYINQLVDIINKTPDLSSHIVYLDNLKRLAKQFKSSKAPSRKILPAKSKPVKKAVPKKEKAVSCPEHNNSGARSPRSSCKGCWAWYEHLHPDRYEAALKRFQSND